MDDSIPALGQFIEPAPVPFSFGAPGWYVVAGIFLLLVLLFIFVKWKSYLKNRYRYKAIRSLEEKEQQLLADQSYSALVYAAEMLMKRIAMERYGRERTASLQGKEWLNFLNRTISSDLFDSNDEKLMASLYLTDKDWNENQVKSFIDKVKHWIKKHKYVIKSI